MTDTPTTPRRVRPRKLTLAGLAAGALAVAGPATNGGIAAAALPLPAGAQSSEAGEAGESGVVLSEGPAEFLTMLGYFEGTYRIASRLYLDGDHQAAADHLEESHHAFYEDIEAQIAAYAAPGFAPEAEAFTAAVREDAGEGAVQTAYDALMARIAENAEAAGASAHDRALSVHDLIKLASAEYEGGVDAGEVIAPIEFRDSWGFYETARARAEGFAASDDADLAEAGAELLSYLKTGTALYPSLTSETAAADASDLVVAAGWSEIIALRLK